jgi:hypothetical protein
MLSISNNFSFIHIQRKEVSAPHPVLVVIEVFCYIKCASIKVRFVHEHYTWYSVNVVTIKMQLANDGDEMHNHKLFCFVLFTVCFRLLNCFLHRMSVFMTFI